MKKRILATALALASTAVSAEMFHYSCEETHVRSGKRIASWPMSLDINVKELKLNTLELDGRKVTGFYSDNARNLEAINILHRINNPDDGGTIVASFNKQFDDGKVMFIHFFGFGAGGNNKLGSVIEVLPPTNEDDSFYCYRQMKSGKDKIMSKLQ